MSDPAVERRLRDVSHPDLRDEPRPGAEPSSTRQAPVYMSAPIHASGIGLPVGHPSTCRAPVHMSGPDLRGRAPIYATGADQRDGPFA